MLPHSASELLPPNAEHMKTFFLQLLKMTQHMMDELLPDLLVHLDRNDLNELIRRSDDVGISIQSFKKLVTVIQKSNLSDHFKQQFNCPANDTANALSSTEQQQQYHKSSNKSVGDTRNSKTDTKHFANEFDDDGVWRALFIRVQQQFNLNKRFMKFYYCGICDTSFFEHDMWIDHTEGKSHRQNCETCAIDSTSLNYSCAKCGLNIFSEEEHVGLVVQSTEHQELDSLIHRELHNTNPSSFQNYSKGGSEEISVVNQSASSDQMFNQVKISQSFIEFNTMVKTTKLGSKKKFTSMFCEPCVVGVLADQAWSDHCSSKKHLRKNISSCVKLVCQKCPFIMLSDSRTGIVYMECHIEICHDESTNRIIFEEYVQIIDITPEKSFPNNRENSEMAKLRRPHIGISASDGISNLTDRNVSPIKIDDECKKTLIDSSIDSSCISSSKNYNRSKGVSISTTPSSTVNYSQGIQTQSPNNTDTPIEITAGKKKKSHRDMKNKPAVPDHQSPFQSNTTSVGVTVKDSSYSNNEMLTSFAVLLRHKGVKHKAGVNDTPFSALCLLCLEMNFPDFNSFNAHIQQHDLTDEQNEVECSECNTYIFGDVNFIRFTLFSNEKHGLIDKHMSRP